MKTSVGIERLCIHQITLMQSGFRQSLELLARHGVPMTAIWHEKFDEVGLNSARKILRETKLKPVSFCIGGTFSGCSAAQRATELELGKRRIEVCAELEIPSLLILTGGMEPGERDLLGARNRALDGIGALIEDARAANVYLILEPLHPMVCGFRSVLSTLGDACDFLDELNADDVSGLALDSYSLWWDLNLEAAIERAGKRIRHFHVSDWLRDTKDIRLDRGMPGDGQIDLVAMRRMVERSGFHGPLEVEILSNNRWWRRPAEEVVLEILKRLPEM